MKEVKKVKIVKYSCCIFLIIAVGVFYSCSREDTEDSVFSTSLERREDYEEVSKSEDDTQEEAAKSIDSDQEMEQVDMTIYVHVCGAVVRPGVYEVSSGKRIFEVIELAGGVSSDGAAHALNQAEVVADGQKIVVPTLEEAENLEPDFGMDHEGGTSGDGLVNINKAGKEELMTLPGIGTSKADSIISYREENGNFQAIEDIKNITGIKDGLFSKIKDKISIK